MQSWIPSEVKYKQYIVVTTDLDGERAEYQYENYISARSTAFTLRDSSLAPDTIEILGYQLGKYYHIEYIKK